MKKVSKNLTLWWTRLGFPTVFEPKQIMLAGRPSGDPKFSATICLDSADPAMQPTIQLVQQTEEALITEAWPDGNVPNDFHRALQWGPQARPNDPHVAQMWILNAYADQDKPPEVVQETEPGSGVFGPLADRSMVYSGCEAHVSIGLFSYQTTATKGGIGVGLNKVFPTGRSFGRFDGRPTAEQAFASPPPMAPEAPVPAAMQQWGPQQQQQPQWGPQQQPGQPQQQQQPQWGPQQQPGQPQQQWGSPQQPQQPGQQQQDQEPQQPPTTPWG